MTEPQTRTKYTYDSLYRLTQAVTPGSTNYPAWGLQWSYDKYGNRTAQSVYSGCSGNTCPTSSLTISTSTNQITGSPYSYDANGNMTNDGQNTLAYDGESRATSATNSSSGGAYVYDGKGLRIQKCVPNCASPTTSTVYIFSNSKVIAEYDNGAAPASPSREYIYAGGKLVSKITSSATSYYHQDHLSNRLVTDTNGNTLEQLGHYPFGESWYNSSNDKLLFTSYERDSESGNDYAMARYYISRLGRFNSPDPMGGNPANPQSWDRYSYVLNDPVNLSDPEGEYCQWDDGTDDDPPDAGGASQDECENQGGTWIQDAPDLGNGLGDNPGDLLNNLLPTGQPTAPPGGCLGLGPGPSNPDIDLLSNDPTAPAGLVPTPNSPIPIQGSTQDGSSYASGNVFQYQLVDGTGAPINQSGITVTEVVERLDQNGVEDTFVSSQQTGSIPGTGPGQIDDFVGIITPNKLLSNATSFNSTTTTQMWFATWQGNTVGLAPVMNQQMVASGGYAQSCVTPVDQMPQ